MTVNLLLSSIRNTTPNYSVFNVFYVYEGLACMYACALVLTPGTRHRRCWSPGSGVADVCE